MVIGTAKFCQKFLRKINFGRFPNLVFLYIFIKFYYWYLLYFITFLHIYRYFDVLLTFNKYNFFLGKMLMMPFLGAVLLLSTSTGSRWMAVLSPPVENFADIWRLLYFHQTKKKKTVRCSFYSRRKLSGPADLSRLTQMPWFFKTNWCRGWCQSLSHSEKSSTWNLFRTLRNLWTSRDYVLYPGFYSYEANYSVCFGLFTFFDHLVCTGFWINSENFLTTMF